MLPEAGAFELVFLAMVALIVVGPKDLPVLLRKLGQFTAKMRGLASEFRSSFDEMARQSELDDLRREVEALRDGRFGDDHKPEIESHLREIHAGLSFDDRSTSAVSAAPAPPPEPPPSAFAHDEPELPFPASHAPHPGPTSHAPYPAPEPDAAHAETGR